MSHRDVILLAGYLVRCPLGGYAWQVLHYLAGLRALGFDAYFYEDTAFYCGSYDPVTNSDNVGTTNGVAFASELFQRFDLSDAWMFWDAQADRVHGTRTIAREELIESARVVVTLAPVTRLPRRPGQTKAFIDLDPGFTQICVAQGDRAIDELMREHDRHFTFGENIGQPGCRVPTAGLRWLPTRQPVMLELWEPCDSAADEPFTTVGKWNESRRRIELEGEAFAWSKRSEWMKFLELPTATGQRFQPALDTHNVPGDSELLRAHGWDPIDPIELSRDALRYRDFIRTSRGEFTVAKDLNVRLATGWCSDRAACYLAAGRPVVTQDTGFVSVLPTGKGLFAVHTMEEAVAAFAAMADDYPAQRLAARAIAEEYFEARRVLSQLVANW